MSPQFVDFDGDGRLDIVAGIFDGSPHLVRGTEQGWARPEQILDRNGDRIVLNAYWDFDAKRWIETHAYDAPGHQGKAHMTSAVAFDWDGDADFDLLLGDHSSGRVFLRINEGTAKEPLFSLENEPVHAGGKPIDVPGTVATMRVVDWNRDGLLDLACGGMGDAYNDGPGGGVYLYLNEGSHEAPRFAAPLTLLQPGEKAGHEVKRPDSAIYMDFGDHDGDGDLDMLVGGYSHWKPKPVPLDAAREARAGELRTRIAELDGALREARAALAALTGGTAKGNDGEAESEARRAEIQDKQVAVSALSKERGKFVDELEALVPTPKRRAYVWLYENLGADAGAVAEPGREARAGK